MTLALYYQPSLADRIARLDDEIATERQRAEAAADAALLVLRLPVHRAANLRAELVDLIRDGLDLPELHRQRDALVDALAEEQAAADAAAHWRRASA